MESSTLSEELTFHLWSDDNKMKEPRYTITIVDAPKSELSSYNGNYAVFIVPQGRENEGTFSTSSGRENLARLAGYCRLAVVTLHREHVYTNLERMQDELSPTLKNLGPKKTDKKIPYLMSSTDIGYRNVHVNIDCEPHGHIIVEDVQTSEGYYCRLLIVNNKVDNVLCQAKLKAEKSNKKSKSKTKICDHRFLLSLYQNYIFTVLFNQLLKNKDPVSILLVGFQSMPLVCFLLELFPELSITLLESDTKLIEISKNYFGYAANNEYEDRLKVITQDPVDYIKQGCSKKYDSVILNSFQSNGYENVEAIRPLLSESSLLFVYDEANEEMLKGMKGKFKSCYKTEIEDKLLVLFTNIKDFKLITDQGVLQKYLQNKRSGLYRNNEWLIELDFELV